MIDVTFKNDTWVDAFRLGHNVRQAGPVRIYETSSVCSFLLCQVTHLSANPQKIASRCC